MKVIKLFSTYIYKLIDTAIKNNPNNYYELLKLLLPVIEDISCEVSSLTDTYKKRLSRQFEKYDFIKDTELYSLGFSKCYPEMRDDLHQIIIQLFYYNKLVLDPDSLYYVPDRIIFKGALNELIYSNTTYFQWCLLTIMDNVYDDILNDDLSPEEKKECLENTRYCLWKCCHTFEEYRESIVSGELVPKYDTENKIEHIKNNNYFGLRILKNSYNRVLVQTF